MRYKYILLNIVFVLFYSFNVFAYNEQDIDLYNHSNQHGVIFHAEDKRAYYDNVTYAVIYSGKCKKDQYKLIRNTAKKLKEKEQPFWVYRYCISAEYKYNTDSIIKAYNSYRFDLNKRLLENKYYKVIDNIASYLPVNLKKGSNYLYYLGMRNNIIEWSEDNNTMHITLPIMFSGIITTMSVEKNNSILVKEIFVYDRPKVEDGGVPKVGYKDLFSK
ncbi:MAG: hypothetical protein K2N11_04400 [Mucispirillum sp.]|nr:hypothetical protein [Mucispirillum sp.]